MEMLALTTFVAPEHELEVFNCSQCGAYASQEWSDLITSSRDGTELSQSICLACGEPTYWYHDWILSPSTGSVPTPNPDLPEEMRSDYLEAKEIVTRSPRGAAALLRLVIQKLCIHLGEPGTNINEDIGALVAKNKVKVRTQRALDTVRVIGNDAVHPGVIDLRDDPELAKALFGLVNLIVTEAISIDRQVDELYAQLPKGKRDGIAQRDRASSTN